MIQSAGAGISHFFHSMEVRKSGRVRSKIAIQIVLCTVLFPTELRSQDFECKSDQFIASHKDEISIIMHTYNNNYHWKKLHFSDGITVKDKFGQDNFLACVIYNDISLYQQHKLFFDGIDLTCLPEMAFDQYRAHPDRPLKSIFLISQEIRHVIDSPPPLNTSTELYLSNMDKLHRACPEQ